MTSTIRSGQSAPRKKKFDRRLPALLLMLPPALLLFTLFVILPLTDAARFPDRAIAWDLNYRGDLVFLDQARAQAEGQGLQIEDGWTYFIHGWTQVIAEVFDIEIPVRGPAFDTIAAIAARVTGRAS